MGSNYTSIPKHAFLSPSSNTWLRYDEDRLLKSYRSAEQKELGTRLHAFAEEAINLQIRQANTKNALNMFINHAIEFKMDTEVPLVYSKYCFGTADALRFNKRLLRVHDYKSGKREAHFDQLRIYAALYCLQEGINPADIDIQLRIYQYDGFKIETPPANVIQEIMEIIIWQSQVLEENFG